MPFLDSPLSFPPPRLHHPSNNNDLDSRWGHTASQWDNLREGLAAGNHCLYNLQRPVLNERLGMGGPETASYYAFQPHPRWRFLVLDGYDLSLLGWPPDHPNHQQALQILNEQNPNEVWSLYRLHPPGYIVSILCQSCVHCVHL